METVFLSWLQDDGNRGFSKDQLKGKQLSPTFRPDPLVVFRGKFREPPISIIGAIIYIGLKTARGLLVCPKLTLTFVLCRFLVKLNYLHMYIFCN